MKPLTSKRIILTKIETLILKSVIGFILGIFLSYSAFTKSLTSLAQNHISNPAHPLFLSADELIYNHDANTISAQGNVQIEYDGNKVIAQEITYHKKTERIIAQGNVVIIQKNGNKIYSNKIDMTKDFGEGFISALYIDTANNVHFTAENAIRSSNQITIFNHATYTACDPCSYKSDPKILWKIKARKIIWNSTIKTIRFENSHFEIFGIPIVQLSAFELYDPTVKRANGFLTPNFFYDDYLGIGIKNSYFWNLTPYYDFTLSATAYTQQGLLTEGEWRQRLKKGNYNIRFAHIYQIRSHNFDNNTINAQHVNRYMLATKGDFHINSRWSYGWDIFTQSDHNFSYTYKLENYSNPIQISKIYLNGLAGKNQFNMHFYHFNVQNLMLNNTYHKHHSQQAWVLPRIDYSFTPDESVYTGMITFHSNMRSIYRRHADFSFINWNSHPINAAQLSSITRNSFRLTNELEWKKRFNTHNGLILTPILALRTDVITTNAHKIHSTHITNSSSPTTHSAIIRGIATVGLELRYPFLIVSGSSTHIVEPTAQIFIRNNEQYIRQIPNEDAKNFVFDATTLFQRDKFSGSDRVEGGTRTNIGMRYSGNLNDDWSLYGLVGQSFHLAGKNSFAEKDFFNVSAHSSLEAARSDYVAMLNINHQNGFSLASRGRFDKKTGKVHHSEIEASQKWKNFSVAVQYVYIPRQLHYEYTQDYQEIFFQTGIKLANYWYISSNIGYDLTSSTFIKQGIGLKYANECFSLTFGYQQTTYPEKKTPSQNFNFSLSLRTITDIGKK
ncbi:LPS-assembly protein LptD [Bartonella sp. B35(2025)]